MNVPVCGLEVETELDKNGEGKRNKTYERKMGTSPSFLGWSLIISMTCDEVRGIRSLCTLTKTLVTHALRLLPVNGVPSQLRKVLELEL